MNDSAETPLKTCASGDEVDAETTAGAPGDSPPVESSESAQGVLSAADAALIESAATVEALLFATDSPLTPARISTVAELPPRIVKEAIELLNDRYERMGAAFRIESIAGGFQMLTLPEYRDVLSRLLRTRSETR